MSLKTEVATPTSPLFPNYLWLVSMILLHVYIFLRFVCWYSENLQKVGPLSLTCWKFFSHPRQWLQRLREPLPAVARLEASWLFFVTVKFYNSNILCIYDYICICTSVLIYIYIYIYLYSYSSRVCLKTTPNNTCYNFFISLFMHKLAFLCCGTRPKRTWRLRLWGTSDTTAPCYQLGECGLRGSRFVSQLPSFCWTATWWHYKVQYVVHQVDPGSASYNIL